ncbi:hypothetical protein KUCAC02_037215, partial [Chaenocephalus aceratus]
NRTSIQCSTPSLAKLALQPPVVTKMAFVLDGYLTDQWDLIYVEDPHFQDPKLTSKDNKSIVVLKSPRSHAVIYSPGQVWKETILKEKQEVKRDLGPDAKSTKNSFPSSFIPDKPLTQGGKPPPARRRFKRAVVLVLEKRQALIAGAHMDREAMKCQVLTVSNHSCESLILTGNTLRCTVPNELQSNAAMKVEWRQAGSILQLGTVTLAKEPDYTGLKVWYDGRGHIQHLDRLANARSVSPTNEMVSHESVDYRTTLLDDQNTDRPEDVPRCSSDLRGNGELLSPRLGGMGIGMDGELVSPLLMAPIHIDPSSLTLTCSKRCSTW